MRETGLDQRLECLLSDLVGPARELEPQLLMQLTLHDRVRDGLRPAASVTATGEEVVVLEEHEAHPAVADEVLELVDDEQRVAATATARPVRLVEGDDRTER